VSYTDLRDFEPEATFDIPALHPSEPALTIAVEKLGGGTPGRRYDGRWRAVVTLGGQELYRGQDLNTPAPHSHREAAGALAEMIAQTASDGDAMAERLSAWR
jgi:hypothetical protein